VSETAATPAQNSSSVPLPPEGPEKHTPILRTIGDVALIGAAAIAAALLLRTFVFEALRIPSHSMEPSLLAGDFVIVSKLPSSGPRRGDVFAFHSLTGDGVSRGDQLYVKRCVAVPGDSVAMADGIIWVNGVRSEVPRPEDVGGGMRNALAGIHRTWVIPCPGEQIVLNESTLPAWHSLVEREGHRVTTGPAGEILVDGVTTPMYRVEQRHYFFAGDNAIDSYDSRYWGLLPERAILGKAILIYWSWDSALSTFRWSRVGMMVR
jgi:signal peptidase I